MLIITMSVASTLLAAALIKPIAYDVWSEAMRD